LAASIELCCCFKLFVETWLNVLTLPELEEWKMGNGKWEMVTTGAGNGMRLLLFIENFDKCSRGSRMLTNDWAKWPGFLFAGKSRASNRIVQR